ncbi:uncharacterized protein LOC106393127 [Brassica napus]|uniref:uncharacterized protein LOC106393127 n=1 Tax=Brassica napus TaxID=3708 RepID=UPI00207A8AED|nr:uncharacterized protein LOC106393127 [Brassica napus]
MVAFWEMLGVDVDVGPTTEQIIAVFGRCKEWSRDDRMRHRYLAIFPGFIKGRKYSTLHELVLQGVAYYALPEFGASYGNPIPNRQSPVLMAYRGEDSAAENIVKVMFNAKPRCKWTMDCWEVTGTKPSVKKEVSAAETESGVKGESGRPRKKARKEKSVEARAKASKGPPTERDIADAMRDGFGMCLKEIKLLGDRMEAVEKKVGNTKKGTASNDLQITASSPPKRGHEPGMYSRGKLEGIQRMLRLWNMSMERLNNTAKLIIPNKRVGQGYDPFAHIDKKMSKVLTDWVKLDPTEHWIAIWISIPKKHIVVWDSIISHISREDLDVIECHALGMSFPPEFCNKNAKAIREKMALDIFKETPGCHSKENEDNDENMGT